MFTTLARSVALGVFAAGAILGPAGIASAHPHGGGGDGDYMDGDLPPWLVDVVDVDRSIDLTHSSPPGVQPFPVPIPIYEIEATSG